ncbi:MAG: hypothetical protein AAGE76_08635 [Pseudomonadota bacterium]
MRLAVAYPAAAYLATALLAAPAAAQDMDMIETCGSGGLDAGGCDKEAFAEALGLLSAGQMRIFRDAGMESFAMLTALRYGASAVFFAMEDEGCYAEEERTAAVEIWSIWVSLPDDAPGAIARKFALYDGAMDAIVNMEVGC